MTSAAHITIAGDGRPMVTMGAVDLSGTRSTMAQVVAEEFGLTIEDVHVQTGDSKSVGYSDGAAGSRVARTMTAALVEACGDALRQLQAPGGREAAECPGIAALCRRRLSLTAAERCGHLFGGADAGHLDRWCRGRARCFEQVAARRRDRCARV